MKDNVLIAAMKRAGITSEALARRLGVSVGTVAKWRSGRAPCCCHMEAAIERAIEQARRDRIIARA